MVQEAILNLFPFKFYLQWNDSGKLIKLNFELTFDLQNKIIFISSPKVLEWIKIFNYAFLEYWNFKKNFVDVPHILLASDFQIKVLKELRLLKIGETITYKNLAERIGNKKAFRAVGSALSKNLLPLVYPCHRVISSKGIGNYSQGVLLKQLLLYREVNYKFLTSNVKNMTKICSKKLEF